MFLFLPIAGPEAIGMAGVRIAIQNVTDLLRGDFVIAVVSFSSTVIKTVDTILAVFEKIDDEEVKHSYELMTALHDVQDVVQHAEEFLEKVEDFFHFSIESKTMANATAGLNCSPLDLKPLCDLMGLLKMKIAQDTKKCEECGEACKHVITTCKESAKVCATKERECQNKKIAGRIGFGCVAIVLVAVVVYTVFENVNATAVAIFVGICICICIHACYIDPFQKREISFRSICHQLDITVDFASKFRTKVNKVHGILERCSELIGYINYSVNQENQALMKDTLKRFKEVCAQSYKTISKHKCEVKAKLKELKRFS